MRKFRNTAIALVSAAAISLGGVTAATAQEAETPVAETTDDKSFSSGSSWNDYHDEYEGEKEGYGIDGFGSSRDDSGEESPKWLDTWGNVFSVLTFTSILGTLVFPAINFLKYNGIIQ
ncbi:hypothetical protein ACMG4H_01915 [Corynebacterium glutamicum]|uniref:hypothetical protein n=1 Tax=Corynebacterium glutamicum TaxID=1718 RepID=UPI003C7AD917